MKRPLVESLAMDLNQSMEFKPSATSSPQVHSFIPMTLVTFPFHHPSKEVKLIAHPASFCSDGEEVKHPELLILKRNLELFWQQQMMEIHNISVFKNQHHLPLARIKRVMKSDKDVKMISSETPVLFSKACELFILELTLRAWLQMEEAKRRTMLPCDIARAISQEEALDFLADIVPVTNNKDGDRKIPAKNECHPVNQLQFPLVDMNPELFLRGPEVQQLMLKPPMFTDAFNLVNEENGNDGT